MNISNEQFIRNLAQRSGFYMKDIKALLKCMSEEVLNLSKEVDAEEDISIQLFDGIKIGCKLVPERERINPKSREAITCKATVKPFAKFTDGFRDAIQQKYDKKVEK